MWESPELAARPDKGRADASNRGRQSDGILYVRRKPQTDCSDSVLGRVSWSSRWRCRDDIATWIYVKPLLVDSASN